MPGVWLGDPAFYRFGERYTGVAVQSALPSAVYRVLPDLVTGHTDQPTRLQPAWLGGGGARPWAKGAAGGRAKGCSRAREMERSRRGRHRGVRAGRRLQLRRHRLDRGAVRAGRDAPLPRCLAAPARLTADEAIPVIVAQGRTAPPRRAICPAAAPPERHLLVPARLTLRQTGQVAARAVQSAARTLKVGHLNVRSLTAHMDDVNLLIQRERLDVLCLGETFLTESVDSCMLVFPGYAICRRDRPAGRSGGGVAVLHRSTLNVQRLRVPATRS